MSTTRTYYSRVRIPMLLHLESSFPSISEKFYKNVASQQQRYPHMCTSWQPFQRVQI